MAYDNKKDLFFPDDLNNQNVGFAIGTEPFLVSPLESEESFSLMSVRENRHFPRDNYLARLRNGSLDLGMRTEALGWISKVHSHFNFGPLSFCLSINYLDRFLSVAEIAMDNPWAVQLLAVACFSIAIKVAETPVILLENLQVCEPKFVFECKTIQRMELLVLNNLNWQIQACTPFSFIDYFVRKINDDVQLSSLALVSSSTELILSLVKEIGFLEFKPSEIAAAVAISVSIGATPDEAISSFNHLEKERVLRCVQLINDLKLVAGGSNATSSSLSQTPNGVLDAASSLTSTKSNGYSSPTKK